MSDPKQRLLEIMSRLDPTFKYKPILNEAKKINKSKLNEYSNAPAGSEDDPRAPWNQSPDAEWNGKFDVKPSIEYIGDIEQFKVIIYSNDPKAEASVSLYELVQKYSHGDDDYYLNAIGMPNPERNPEFMNKINMLLQQYVNDKTNHLQWEYDEPDPNYGEY